MGMGKEGGKMVTVSNSDNVVEVATGSRDVKPPLFCLEVDRTSR
jgi:hypothetical protein